MYARTLSDFRKEMKCTLNWFTFIILYLMKSRWRGGGGRGWRNHVFL